MCLSQKKTIPDPRIEEKERTIAMNSFERVKMALNHQEPDRVPVYPLLAGVNRALVGVDYPTWSTDADACAEGFIKTAEQFDLDAIVTLIDLSVECDAWGQPVIYPATEAAHPDWDNLVVQDVDEFDKVQKVDWRNSKRMRMHVEVCKKIVAKLKGEKPIIAFVFGPLGTLSMLRNQQEIFMDIYDDPDAVKEATWHVAETLADYVAALCDTGVDGIMWDTLFASGSIMKKEMWADLEMEPMQMLSKVVRDHGCLNMLHNCGAKPYFDGMIEAAHPDAISFLNPPADCADLAETKAKYGDKTMLIGCVAPTNVVVGSDEEWEAECKQNIDLMAKGGGYMLAPGCEYPANAPLDRAQKMIDIAKTYGVYQK